VIRPAAIAADLTGTRGEGLHIVFNVPAPGLLRVAVYGAFPATGDGVFADLKFSVIGSAGESTSLIISQFVFNDGTAGVMKVNGGIKVVAPDISTRRLAMLTGEPVWPRVF
jgi:hypothetical protein